MVDLTVTQWEEIYARLDEICGEEVQLEDGIKKLQELNAAIPAGKMKYCCWGSNTGLKKRRQARITGTDFFVKKGHTAVINGKVLLSPSQKMPNWFNSPIPYAVKQHIIGESGELIEREVEATGTVRTALYKGNTVVIGPDVKTKDMEGMCVVKTPQNLEYYGFIEWQGKVYTPGLSSYHGSSRLHRNEEASEARFKFGVEIEKVYEQGRRSLSHKYINKRLRWAAESDSSLGSSGYEMVSPIYDMENLDVFKEDLEVLRRWVDKKPHTTKAGGHINVSVSDYGQSNNGKQLLKSILGFVPMLYAMYPKRAENGYSEAVKMDRMMGSPSKRAFYPKDNRLEIRIFPEVESVEDMIQRVELVKLLITHATKQVEVAITYLMDANHDLCKHIVSMGFDPKSICEKILEWDFKLEGTRYVKKTHDDMKALGLKILSRVKLSPQAKGALKRKLIKQLAEYGSEDQDDLVINFVNTVAG